MIVLWIFIGVFAVIAFLYLFLLVPCRRRKEAEPFWRVPYAHRGLHGDEIPENSLEAFSRAIEAGYGIELDVQLSADGEVMVFHDENLLRMTGVDASLFSKTKEELAALCLAGKDAHIPTFAQVLALVNGRVPLLVEIKSDHGVRAVCEKTAALLDAYTGPYMVESFHPMAVSWFRKNRPSVVRGQLSCRLFVKGKRTLSYFVVQNLLLNFLARPDFIAYDYRNKNRFSFALCRALYRPYTVAWTLKDASALPLCTRFDGIIFESIDQQDLRCAGRFENKNEGENE